MGRSRKPLGLKCAMAVVAVALLAATIVPVAAAKSQPVTLGGRATEQSVTAARHVESNRTQPYGSGKTYFWSDLAITGGVLAGIVVLAIWGDVAIGGAILVIQLLCVGAATAARKIGARARTASRRVWQVAGSNP